MAEKPNRGEALRLWIVRNGYKVLTIGLFAGLVVGAIEGVFRDDTIEIAIALAIGALCMIGIWFWAGESNEEMRDARDKIILWIKTPISRKIIFIGIIDAIREVSHIVLWLLFGGLTFKYYVIALKAASEDLSSDTKLLAALLMVVFGAIIIGIALILLDNFRRANLRNCFYKDEIERLKKQGYGERLIELGMIGEDDT